MNINNPTTFGTPNLTLSTSNSSGTGGALRADDTILVYDTSAVDAITYGQSGSVGSASTASRRDHAHAMASLAAPNIGCFVYNDADVPLANNTHTALAMNQERFDTDTMHDSDTDNTRITAKTAGTYFIYGSIDFATASGGSRVLYIKENGGHTIGWVAVYPGTATQVTATWELAVDEYVELFGYQNSGGAVVSNTSDYYAPTFSALMVGSA